MTKKSQPTFAELVSAEFANSKPLAEAEAKLADLRSRQLQVASELEQLEAATDVDIRDLAARVLQGDDLEGQEALFAKRAATQQRAAAFAEAVKLQEQEVTRVRSAAAVQVSQAVSSAYQSHVTRYQEAVQALEDALAQLSMVGGVVSRHGLGGAGWVLPNLRNASTAVQMLRSTVEVQRDRAQAQTQSQAPAAAHRQPAMAGQQD
jgi:hypothetical protein